MSPLLFWVFAVLMLVFAASVILQPNAVSSAVSLVVSFIALAALYVSLDAFFIGAIQILVYAGAVMVLFLFIIMLLDLKSERQHRSGWPTSIGGLLVAILFVGQLSQVLNRFPAGSASAPPLRTALTGANSDVRQVGLTIFTDYNLPLQIVGVLILTATIGVIVLSKRELK